MLNIGDIDDMKPIVSYDPMMKSGPEKLFLIYSIIINAKLSTSFI